MAPSNNKSPILAAAYALAGRDGAAAITLDAVAAEAGVSKGGLIYHFRSKEALLTGLMQHLTDRWEQRLLAELPGPVAESTLPQRLRAYVVVAADPTDGPTSADLSLIVDGAHRRQLTAIWQTLLDRWITPDELTPRQRAAIAAADGIWTTHALGSPPTPADTVDVLLDLIGDDT